MPALCCRLNFGSAYAELDSAAIGMPPKSTRNENDLEEEIRRQQLGWLFDRPSAQLSLTLPTPSTSQYRLPPLPSAPEREAYRPIIRPLTVSIPSPVRSSLQAPESAYLMHACFMQSNMLLPPMQTLSPPTRSYASLTPMGRSLPPSPTTLFSSIPAGASVRPRSRSTSASAAILFPARAPSLAPPQDSSSPSSRRNSPAPSTICGDSDAQTDGPDARKRGKLPAPG